MGGDGEMRLLEGRGLRTAVASSRSVSRNR
jgi:hypothetical protein